MSKSDLQLWFGIALAIAPAPPHWYAPGIRVTVSHTVEEFILPGVLTDRHGIARKKNSEGINRLSGFPHLN
ncbi:hypothetical protein [Klebsiella pneumoniae]|uniref:hypothetical protein n=1 Tax=Klebsiella pneumoniae TaxID=573 RepID=UPI002272249A|nr:hypothetical protein [Klebsiella pneumoniae]MCY0155227.1 hypothetical protein [Klebsiella pneumoniae]